MRRTYVFGGLVAVVVVAVASPALGGPSLRSLVRKEVKKQLAGKTGPQGPAGTSGSNGTNGTARAYAEVLPRGFGGCPGGPPAPCSFDRDKGIASVTYLGTGEYCIVAPGIDPGDVTPAVSVDWTETNSPEGNASAMNQTQCSPGGFEVITEREVSVSVRDAADTGTISVAGNATPDDDVGFDIVIP
jgi:hypothetical protein